MKQVIFFNIPVYECLCGNDDYGKVFHQHKALKHLLAVLSYVLFIFVVDSHSLPYPYYTVVNKWSVLTICYVLLLENILFPLIAGLYPALRIFMLMPEAKQGCIPLAK